METTKKLVTLDKQLIKQSEELQKKLTGSVNLSSLLNKLLGEWIQATNSFLLLSPLPRLSSYRAVELLSSEGRFKF